MKITGKFLFILTACLTGFSNMQAQTYSGNCGADGDNVQWAISEDTLTVSGSGAMADYARDQDQTTAPWSQYKSSFSTIVIEENVTNIGKYAFAYLSVSSVTVPGSVTSIGTHAFYNSSMLTDVTVGRTQPPTLRSSYVFAGISSSAALRVPVGSIEAYRNNATGWSSFAAILNFDGDSEDPVFVTGVSLNPPSVDLTVDGNITTTLTATVQPEGATNKAVSWQSSNTAVADTLSTGNSTALVTVKGTGEAWIIVTTEDRNYADSCLVTVSNPNLEAVETAKGLIEAKNWTVAQTTANTESKVKKWLVTQINAILSTNGTGITVTEENIAVSAFKAATAGTPGVLNGNGSFAFTVTLTKGSVSRPTESRTGAITSTHSGTCGAWGNETNVQWAFSDGKVTIWGTGAMAGFSEGGEGASPWHKQFGDNVKTVDIRDGVTLIGENAFVKLINMTSITIPESVTYIDHYAVSGCPWLDSLICRREVPPAVSEFHALDANPRATLYVPVGSIEAYRRKTDGWSNFATRIRNFNGASDEGTCGGEGDGTNVQWEFFPNGKLTIWGTGPMADFGPDSSPWHQFGDNVKTVDIRDSVTTIGVYAFSNLFGINSITCGREVPPALGDDLVFANISPNATLHVPVGSIQAYSDAEGWSSFPTILNFDGADASAEGTWDDGDNIIQWAFSPSDGKLTIWGKGNIGEQVPWEEFKDEVKTVVIGDSVTTIGQDAFKDYPEIDSITIPASVTHVGGGAFDGCQKLISITCRSVLPPTLGWGTFTHVPYNATLHVPVGSIQAYRNFSGEYIGPGPWWNSFTVFNLNGASEEGTCGADGDSVQWEFSLSDRQLTIWGTGAIADYEYRENYQIAAPWGDIKDGIWKIVIKEGVTTIGDRAFEYLANVGSAIIPSSVTNIHFSAFYYSYKLSDVTCRNPVPPNLGKDVFDGISLSSPATTMLRVPVGSIRAYRDAPGWGDHFTTILNFEGKDEDPPVTAISIAPKTVEDLIVDGDSTTLTATVVPGNAGNKRVTWSAEPSGIVKLTPAGGVNDSACIVTAVGAGTATITATAAGDETISDSRVVTVSNPNLEAVETAKGLIEAQEDVSYWTVAQATVNTESAVKKWLVTQINAISGMSATGIPLTEANIAFSAFNAAVAGTPGMLNGIPGSFTFTVTLAKGSSSRITASRTGTITATPRYTVTVGSFANGTVTSNSTALDSSTVTLTIAPANGYELDTIYAHKTGEADTPVQLNGTGNTRTFTMLFPVTVTATFKKTQNLTAVETAKGLIEAKNDVSYWTVAQATANDTNAVKGRLLEQITDILSGTGITVSVANIAFSAFNGATAGTSGNFSGSDGSFTFTVTLTKGSVSRITASRTGAITATSRYTVTVSPSDSGSVTSNPTSPVLEGTVVTLTIAPAYGCELQTISARKTGGTDTVVSLKGTGNTRTFTMPSSPVTVTAVFKKTQNLTAVETAKGLIEAKDASYWKVAQTAANTESAVKGWLAGQINAITGMSVTGAAANITVSAFNGATAGTPNYLNGSPGSFAFTVTLTKNGISRTTAGRTGAITATPRYAVTVGSFANGAVTSNSTAFFGGNTVTLTVAPAANYELQTISAHKTGETGTTVSINGTGNARTFTMPSYPVTVTAAFKKTQATLDGEAVETAKGLIEAKDASFWTVAQTTANDVNAVKGWLAGQINAILNPSGTGITVAATNIKTGKFTLATAGTPGNPDAIHGLFSFTVQLTKRSVSQTTNERTGTITAMPYVPNGYAVYIDIFADGAVTSNQTSPVLEGTAVTLAIAPDNGYGLDSIFARKTGDTGTTVPLNITSNARIFTMPSFDVTVTAAFKKTQNLLDVETAKGLIEDASYWTVAQAAANDTNAVKSRLAGQINAITGMNATGIAVTAANITVGDFIGATAGTPDYLNGNDGSFTFTVQLTKGSASRTTEDRTGTITATPRYAVTVSSSDNGTVTSDPTTFFEGSSVTLTVAPANGYGLQSISATGETGTTVPLNGTGNARTFTMPSFPVTVTAAFEKTQNLLDIETAKELIEANDDSYWTVAQATANTESAMKSRLAGQINAILNTSGTGITVAAANIAFSDFKEAIAGIPDNPDGDGGSFTFTVTLTKNGISRTTDERTGTITATPRYVVTVSSSDNGTVTSDPTASFEGSTVTLAVKPAADYELQTVSVHKTGDTVTTVPLNGTGNKARTFTMPSFPVTVTAVFKKTQNLLDVETAKELIENVSSWTVLQATANDEDAVKGWLVEQINAILDTGSTDITVAATDINITGDVTSATAGTFGNFSGSDGSFAFTVTLTKGNSFRTTDERTGTITATPCYAVTVSPSDSGSVTSDSTVFFEGSTVTLTVDPATDYELQTISAHKTGATGTTVPIYGTGNIRTFTMPSFDVTVTATFKKTQNLTDVEKAKELIEAKDASYWTVAHSLAPDADAVEVWLAEQINDILNTSGTGITVAATNIAVDAFNGATAGTPGNLNGSSGSFVFTVQLTKGSVSLITAGRTGAITATPYVFQTGVILDPPSATLSVGATLDLTATVEPGNATNRSVSWRSSNPTVADTLSTGDLTAVVTAKAAGDAWIIATATDGSYADSCLVRVPVEGTCGENLRWTLVDSVLTVSGSGAMADFEEYHLAPWYAHRDAVKSVIVESEITHIGSKAFCAEYGNLTSVTNLRLSPQTIDANVFSGLNLSDMMLYVPAGGSRGSYLKAAVWKDFKKVQRIGITGAEHNDAVLSNLVVSSGDRKLDLEPQFFSGITNYTLSVENSVSSVTITATPNDREAIILFGDGDWLLAPGNNNIRDIVVEAENGNRKTYTITVIREFGTGISVAAEPVEAHVYFIGENLYVNSPVAERISVYSVTGVLLYGFNKQAGASTASTSSATGASTASTGSATSGSAAVGSAIGSRGILIVKGSSGWVRKLYFTR